MNYLLVVTYIFINYEHFKWILFHNRYCQFVSKTKERLYISSILRYLIDFVLVKTHLVFINLNKKYSF